MNTGIQRSSATPEGAWTTTTPVGAASPGKIGPKKDLIAFALAHHVDYAATAAHAYWSDFITKIQKAADVEGPALIHVIAPCPLGWRFTTDQTIQMGRLAVQSRYFPLYEVEKGKYKLSVNPHQSALDDFLKMQGRFNHLFKPEYCRELAALKSQVEERWAALARTLPGKTSHLVMTITDSETEWEVRDDWELIGRCAECRDCYGNDCAQCTICGSAPYEVCLHCPPSLILGGNSTKPLP